VTAVVPHAFLFRYSFPIRRADNLPRKQGPLLDLSEDYLLPDLGALQEQSRFAALRMAWSAGGIGFRVDVRGKRDKPLCRAAIPEESDGLQVWIDTRNTQSIHRASRFCHHFCALPAGEGRRGDAWAVQLPIARAREEAPLARPGQLPVRADLQRDGYILELWLPADCLTGFGPESYPRLGFYVLVRDSELGEQYLTVGREFPFASDPSLWSTAELVA
jgi:hypothetical protein